MAQESNAYLGPKSDSVRLYKTTNENNAIKGFMNPVMLSSTPIERSNGNPGGYLENIFFLFSIMYRSLKGPYFSGRFPSGHVSRDACAQYLPVLPDQAAKVFAGAVVGLTA